jgi:hypothetical protein
MGRPIAAGTALATTAGMIAFPLLPRGSRARPANTS